MTDTGVWPPIDRAAHRRGDHEWLAAAWARAKVIVIAPDGRARIAATGGLLLVASADLEGERLFLGVDGDGIPYFAIAAEPSTVDDAPLKHLWEVGHELIPRDARIWAQALGLIQWHNDHRYSPMTGEATTMENGGWIRREASGEMHFPRTDPAVIMLVHDGVKGPDGQALLGSGVMWLPSQGVRRYSTLAGFVEPGETAEAAVAREVFEEAGVHVRDVTYFGSQPHPFPRSLMLGFFALADPSEPVRIDPEELADARWFTRGEVLAVLERRSDLFRLPNRSSIAYRLVSDWAGS